ncbi:rhodanese-like domain-containing protein [Phaeobacter gallaeciensis]|uniref:rhodanese-like domain-containing protein n=1 Tax=Rhodobacterales TaxID=204455 RepID=UPI00237F8AE6|nr:rhodanese-like domain-containing protein [Phaeobacter gallaeciensis]MDF1774222.1 rhodanese-like domain-containing protein [Pseudophaeobacter sp. bin_em_oilr2.035]MDE4193449.1 rhodanese-like domain-containing protein [Phaeobacter gallaeciensis]MDE4201702.1 rhodanese-like domain-containing protein [Phaeobacter gallaeciensis]MDE4205885.1 rhodanese-like domain-containing protein [Phaeobacter gallaeciensis]MDE4210035.1 rhodanese-like domain-containing protein [Phaeobacter gallaeciensis]
MRPDRTRRFVLAGLAASGAAPFAKSAWAQGTGAWSAGQAYDALLNDTARVIDIRSREEWQETGIGAGVWPISMHEARFADRLFAARSLAGERTVGLICATGGRSLSVLGALLRAGYTGYADISEGMLGSAAGPGWIAAGLPVVPLVAALAPLPKALA